MRAVVPGILALAAAATSVSDDVLVERVRWPVRLEGRCGSLAPEDVVVLEDGVECHVSAVDVERPVRVHALLIDNSHGLAPEVDRLRKAALRYLRGLPPDDSVLITSHADNVLLESGLSRDRAHDLTALEQMPLGHNTALRDALYYTIRYLRSRAERKVVILFTDTFETSSLGGRGRAELRSLVRSVPDLTLFTVHLKRNRSQVPNDEKLLRELTYATGGEYYRVRSPSSLGGTFRDIRRRLADETFVTYEPPLLGDGPRDDPSARFRHREVTVRSRSEGSCRIDSRGPPTRVAGDVPVSSGVPIRESFVPPSPVKIGKWEVAETTTLPAPPGWPLAAPPLRLHRVEPPTAIPGEAFDLMEEKGSRYDPRLYAERGLFEVRSKQPAAFESRRFIVELPPLDVVRAVLTDPVRVVLYMLDNAESFPEDPRRHVRLVHGQTWLEIRSPLARVMYESRADYRRWANGKLEEIHRERVDRLLAEYSRGRELSDAERARIREVLLAEAERPGPEHLESLLAEWLRDVRAGELARGIQLELINRLLAADRNRAPDVLADIETDWARFVDWLPAPGTSRVLTALVPSHDGDRDVIGFHRLVASRDVRGGPPADPVPERAQAVDLVAGLPSAAEIAVVDLSWVPLRVAVPDGNDSAPPLAVPPHPAFRTELVLGTAAGERWSMSGIHERSGGVGSKLDLVCVRARLPRNLAGDVGRAVEALVVRHQGGCPEAEARFEVEK